MVLVKYKFKDELETGLIVKKDERVSLIFNGEIFDTKCSALGDVGVEGIPCLVSRTNFGKKVIVEALSQGISETGRKNWICVRPILYEQAVGFFLEKYMMGNLIREYNVVKRDSGSGQQKYDFMLDKTAIDIKVLLPVVSAYKGNIQMKPPVCSFEWIRECINHLTALKDDTKKKILLIVCAYGFKDGVLDSWHGYLKDTLKSAKVEIWLAEMFMDADGIGLVSYQNIEDCHA